MLVVAMIMIGLSLLLSGYSLGARYGARVDRWLKRRSG